MRGWPTWAWILLIILILLLILALVGNFSISFSSK